MKNTSTIAVIGGTGKAGGYLVQTLIEKGFSLKMLVRNPDNFTLNHPTVKVIHGDVRDYETVARLIEGCSVVLSTLGGSPLSEPTVFSKATRNIITAMSQYHLKRYIVVAGLNVNTPDDAKGAKTQAGTDWMYANFPESTRDRQDEYNVLAASDLDWTLIRLPLIKQTDERFGAHSDTKDCQGDSISANDLADFIIDQMHRSDFIGKAPFVFNR